jgi:uncharacterized protein
VPRQRCCRRVECRPDATFFKPRGIPMPYLEQVALALDEFEALRLADLEGRHQEAAARSMRVSRATFGRILESAHRKVADVLVYGKALEITNVPWARAARRPTATKSKRSEK